MKRSLDVHNIKMYHTENEEISAMVERFNRMLNNKMKVQFEVRKNFRWVDILQELLKTYNNSVHRTIGMGPTEVTKDVEHELRMLYVKNEQTPTIPKLKVGNRVRIIFEDTFINK